MLSIEELSEVLEEIRIGESTDSPFILKGTDYGKELQ